MRTAVTGSDIHLSTKSMQFVILLATTCLCCLAASAEPAEPITEMDREHEAVLRIAFLSRRAENNERTGNYKIALQDYAELVSLASSGDMTAAEMKNLLRKAYACAVSARDMNSAYDWADRNMKFALRTSGKNSLLYAEWLQVHSLILFSLGQRERAEAEKLVAERILTSRQTLLMDPSKPLTDRTIFQD
ncbi:MAG: hypothetical protein K2W95_25770 [Candidatus Obscuribacterales bacterium]|nr:hypothetical protein [Candidatus Obscuribacterales bacterium]